MIRDLDEAISDPGVTSGVIAEAIKENIGASVEEDGPGPTGGSIKRLVEASVSLLHKRHEEDPDSEDKAAFFTDNMLASVSVLLGLEVGWNEITEEEVRFTSSSGVLALVDNLGFMFSQEVEMNETGCQRRESKFTQVGFVFCSEIYQKNFMCFNL